MQRKLFAAGLVMLLACGAPVTVSDVQQALTEQAEQAASEQRDQQDAIAKEFDAPDPFDSTGWFISDIAEGGRDASQALCRMFTGPAQAEFAAAQRTGDCQDAVEHLHADVTDRNLYLHHLYVPANAATISGPFAEVHGCTLRWYLPDFDLFGDPYMPVPPGPLPGDWLMMQGIEDRWQVIAYQAC